MKTSKTLTPAQEDFLTFYSDEHAIYVDKTLADISAALIDSTDGVPLEKEKAFEYVEVILTLRKQLQELR